MYHLSRQLLCSKYLWVWFMTRLQGLLSPQRAQLTWVCNGRQGRGSAERHLYGILTRRWVLFQSFSLRVKYNIFKASNWHHIEKKKKSIYKMKYITLLRVLKYNQISRRQVQAFIILLVTYNFNCGNLSTLKSLRR